MLSMVPGVSVMEMTRKVAYKQKFESNTAKLVCLKIKIIQFIEKSTILRYIYLFISNTNS